ncbi:hypothetical protein C8039_08100 [Halogeometricum sp. wsp3]|nr:hypothetical protein C8039_08100 [Halogeometricum sp. wsp3]
MVVLVECLEMVDDRFLPFVCAVGQLDRTSLDVSSAVSLIATVDLLSIIIDFLQKILIETRFRADRRFNLEFYLSSHISFQS